MVDKATFVIQNQVYFLININGLTAVNLKSKLSTARYLLFLFLLKYIENFSRNCVVLFRKT